MKSFFKLKWILLLFTSFLCSNCSDEEENYETKTVVIEEEIQQELITMTTEIDESKNFSLFTKVYYKGVEYSSEEAENSEELIQFVNRPNVSMVVTQDLEKYESFVKSRKSLSEQPKFELLYLYDLHKEADVFMQKYKIRKEAIERQQKGVNNDNCDEYWESSIFFYDFASPSGYVGLGKKLIYAQVTGKWFVLNAYNVPNWYNNRASLVEVYFNDFSDFSTTPTLRLYDKIGVNQQIGIVKVKDTYSCEESDFHVLMSGSARRGHFKNNKMTSFAYGMY